MGKDIHRTIEIRSGLRTNYEQWVAYQDHLRGGTLAAPCCSRGYIHSWEDCGKQCRSNHCRSRAVDCGVIRRSGRYVSIGEYADARRAMRRRGLCLPVGYGEVWHVEVGNIWRS